MRRKKRQAPSSRARKPKTAKAGAKAVRYRDTDEYRSGYADGFRQGKEAGEDSYDSLFEGTSIVIPVLNQASRLKRCIESIADRTDLPYEIVVVDGGSNDGTEAYLRQLTGQIRYRILEGFEGRAAAVNRGLMMAKGTTFVVLDANVVVTDNWLDNLLLCLDSDARIGMAGPVSNGADGEQRMSVDAQTLEQMMEFAERNNQSDSSRWVGTDVLGAFCVLFRRELWESAGYWDERFDAGDYDIEDYCTRAKLLGYGLRVAKDAFVCSAGTEDETETDEQANIVNMHRFMDKWRNAHELMHAASVLREREGFPSVQGFGQAGAAPAAGRAPFYPQGIAVKGLGDRIYWIEGDKRFPVMGDWPYPAVKLSNLDIRRWPAGEPLPLEEAGRKWLELHEERPRRPDHGILVCAPDGFFYYIEHGSKRRIASAEAARCWLLHARPAADWSAERLEALPEGLPVISPTLHRQAL